MTFLTMLTTWRDLVDFQTDLHLFDSCIIDDLYLGIWSPIQFYNQIYEIRKNEIA